MILKKSKNKEWHKLDTSQKCLAVDLSKMYAFILRNLDLARKE